MVAPRSHDSRVYGQRFMLRLDETTMRTLQHLAEQSDQSRAKMIRQLIAHATPVLPAPPDEAGCPSVTVCFTPGENCTQTIVQAVGGRHTDDCGPSLVVYLGADREGAAGRP